MAARSVLRGTAYLQVFCGGKQTAVNYKRRPTSCLMGKCFAITEWFLSYSSFVIYGRRAFSSSVSSDILVTIWLKQNPTKSTNPRMGSRASPNPDIKNFCPENAQSWRSITRTEEWATCHCDLEQTFSPETPSYLFSLRILYGLET